MAVEGLAGERIYPAVAGPHAVARPVSFVTVRFSGDLAHNLLRSECVRDPANQLVVVDNRHNLLHDTLGQAIEQGVARARHDLVVVVHEDVLLPAGWQPALERSLLALDRHDPDWAVAGVAGWRDDGSMHGHWSDPHGYYDLLQGHPFAEVDRIDEHLIAFRRRRRIVFDPRLPSIHNIGRDLAQTAQRHGRRVYVVNAPTIHKFADSQGRRIRCKADSPKIAARETLTYAADLACSDRYLQRKWANDRPGVVPAAAPASVREGSDRLSTPIVLLARGGGGSRLLSVLAADAGVFMGSRLNPSGDAVDMVQPVYRTVLARHRYADSGLVPEFVREMRLGAMRLLGDGGETGAWGFKLPEALLVLDEILEAFPQARFVHMVRDPLATCLRRTHMTARFDNQVGQASLLAAYRALGRDPRQLANDPEAVRMAVTTVHQVGGALDWTRALPPERLLQIRFEDVLRDPGGILAQLGAWLGSATAGEAAARRPQGGPGHAGVPAAIFSAVDPGRAAHPSVVHPPLVVRQVAGLLQPLRQRLGYHLEDPERTDPDQALRERTRPRSAIGLAINPGRAGP